MSAINASVMNFNARFAPIPGGNQITGSCLVGGMPTLVAVGTRTARSITNWPSTRLPRLGIVSGATAGSSCGLRNNLAYLPSRGAWTTAYRFSLPESPMVVGASFFMGISTDTTAISASDPGTLTVVGIGHSSTDSTFQLYRRGWSSPIPPLDTGILIETGPGMFYELVMSPIHASFRKIKSGFATEVLTESIDTVWHNDTPYAVFSAGTAYNPFNCFRANNATSSAVSLDIMHVGVTIGP